MSRPQGANPEQLEQVAGMLEGRASTIDGISRSVRANLYGFGWHGRHADQIRSHWDQAGPAALGGLSAFLRERAQQLRHEATQQRGASRGDSITALHAPLKAGLSLQAGAVGRAAGGGAVPSVDLRGLRQEIAQIRDEPADRQAAWWSSLDQAQRDQLLAKHPEYLLGLPGLPKDVQDEALRRYNEELRKHFVTSSKSRIDEGKIKFVWFSIAGDISVKKMRMADGSYQVSVEVGGKAGAEATVRAATAGAEVSASETKTYTFANEAEAQKFVDQMKLSNIAKIQGILKQYENQKIHDVVAVSATESVSVGDKMGDVGAKFTLGATEKISRDTVSGDLTLKIGISGDGKFSMPGLPGTPNAEVKGDLSVSFTLDSNNQPKTIKIEGDFSIAGGISGKSIGEECIMSITIDPTDPRNAELIQQLQADIQRGDMQAVMTDIQKLESASEIVIQTFDEQSSTSNKGPGISETNVTKNSSGIWVKPFNSNQWESPTF